MFQLNFPSYIEDNIGKYLVNVENWRKTRLKHKRCSSRALHMFGFNESTLKNAWSSMPEMGRGYSSQNIFFVRSSFAIYFSKGCFSQKIVLKRLFLTNFPKFILLYIVGKPGYWTG